MAWKYFNLHRIRFENKIFKFQIPSKLWQKIGHGKSFLHINPFFLLSFNNSAKVLLIKSKYTTKWAVCTNWYCSTIEIDLDHAHQIKQKSGSNRVNLRSERDVCTGNTLDTELSAREYKMVWNILWSRILQNKLFNAFLYEPSIQ